MTWVDKLSRGFFSVDKVTPQGTDARASGHAALKITRNEV
jgi:hypothetical protein